MVDDEPMLTLQIRLPRSMIQRIDKLRFGMTMRPTRTATIRWCIENALNILETKDDVEKST